MTIELIQGDVSCIYKFQRKDIDGKIITSLPQKMWITFKSDYDNITPIFQKALFKDISYNQEDNFYRFKIESKDTENLSLGTYGFDIAIINENGDKKTLLNDGKLKIVHHYTKKANEV